MKNQALYAFVIFTISTLLITTTIFAANAKTFDKDSSFSIKGKQVVVDGSDFDFTIALNADGETVLVRYVIDTDSGSFGGVCVDVPKDIIQIQGLGKASIEFNTSVLDGCFYPGGIHEPFDISFEIKTDGNATNEKLDGSHECDSDGFCMSQVGTSVGKNGRATGIILGEEVDSGARISNVNLKFTFWTEP